jgi:hypothetical protein
MMDKVVFEPKKFIANCVSPLCWLGNQVSKLESMANPTKHFSLLEVRKALLEIHLEVGVG